jgi:hypothetical protein
VLPSGECGTGPLGSITWRDSRLTENLVAFQGGIGSMRIDSLLVCLFAGVVGCSVGWLFSQLALAYDSRSSYCDMEAPQYNFRIKLKYSFPTVSTSVNDIRKL